MNKILGFALIAVGLIGLVWGGLSYTSREKVDLGPIDVSRDKTNRLPIPPIVGGLALIGGIVLLSVGGKK